MMDWILTYLWHGGSGIGPFSADPVYFWGNRVENDADSMPNLLQTANEVPRTCQMTQNDVLLIHLTCARQFLIQDHLEWSIDGQNGSD